MFSLMCRVEEKTEDFTLDSLTSTIPSPRLRFFVEKF
jgi:hypothetical protein